MFPETALVTGGASGIGAAIVAALESDGASVRVLDLATGFDVGDPAAWEQVDAVDAAFLNAGVVSHGQGVEEYERVRRVNLDGVVYGALRMAEVMHAGSAIVVTSSLAGLVPVPGDPVYALTKHAVLGYARSLAGRLAGRGIRVNAICPGLVDTPMTASMRAELGELGFPLIPPAFVAEAALIAARSQQSGEAWVVQPGREPLQFRFPGVPGPRGAGEGQVPPIGTP